MTDALAITADLWESAGPAAWCFVTLPREAAAEIDDRPGRPGRRGFGSRRVKATVGGTTWYTSVFPDTARGSYLLPVKRDVRRREDLQVGDRVHVVVELVTDNRG